MDKCFAETNQNQWFLIKSHKKRLLFISTELAFKK